MCLTVLETFKTCLCVKDVKLYRVKKRKYSQIEQWVAYAHIYSFEGTTKIDELKK